MNPFSSLCDDFGVYVYLNTKMELPSGRETVLHFFESLRKIFPKMTDFDCRETGEFVLEEDREQGSYRWVTLESRRLCMGYVNPPNLEDADTQHEHVLELAPYHLDFGPLDCEALDVLFAFDFMFQGNHDEVVAEALGLNTTLESLLQMPGSRVINYEPSLMLSLDEGCRLQCRLSIETRTNAYQCAPANLAKRPSASTSLSVNTGAGSRSLPSASRIETSGASVRSWSIAISFQQWCARSLKQSRPSNKVNGRHKFTLACASG